MEEIDWIEHVALLIMCVFGLFLCSAITDLNSSVLRDNYAHEVVFIKVATVGGICMGVVLVLSSIRTSLFLIKYIKGDLNSFRRYILKQD